ncbi:hypothetical protein BH18VER1_BH18VER1_15930 [soil metagenome]
MQLLIVHDDAEVGEQLVAMLTEYTEHHCGYAKSGAAALDWARAASRCSLLITQLDVEGVNGLSLGATMSEMFAGLQTMFLPQYPATEQRLETPHSKVFPEPIDGQRLLDAIAHAETQRQTGTDLYHPFDVVQMCCLSQRSGALQFVCGTRAAVFYLRSGNVVHAEEGVTRGEEALVSVAGWEAAEFAYDYTMRAPVDTIVQPWHESLTVALDKQRVQAVHPADSRLQSAGPQEPSPEAKPARRGLFGGARKAVVPGLAALWPLLVR